MRITVFSSDTIGVALLKSLLLYPDCTIPCVYTTLPQERGRGKILSDTDVGKFATENNIKLERCNKFDSREIEKLKKLDLDLGIVVSYGYIIPKDVLDIPKFGFINIHPSALPRWRGAAPIERSIEADDKYSEICIMQMSPGLDDGDVISRYEINIEKMNSIELKDYIIDKAPNMILDVINQIKKDGSVKSIQQSEDGITYAHKIDKSELEINFSDDVKGIHNKIRAFVSKGGCFIIFQNQRLKILKADYLIEQHDIKYGHIDMNNFNIFCKNGILIPKILQKEGKKPVNVKEFLNGIK